MNIGLFVLRLFGLKRAPARTRLGKYARRSERALTITGFLYVGLVFFPQPLFGYNVHSNGVTVYSRAPLPAETTARIEETMALLKRSELFVPGRSERIFVCNNPWLFRLFAPVSPDSFAISYPVSDNVFICEADLARNIARSRAPANNQRSFSSVAAHEITHGLIRHRLGLLKGVLLAKWVDEGYSDYVSQESSFPEEKGIQYLREGTDDPSRSFQYFVYRQMVRHLIEERHYSFGEIAKRAGDMEAIKAETVAALKEGERP